MNLNATNKNKIVSIIVVVTITFLTAYSLEGSTMSLFTKPEEEVVLCSPMEGIITYENKPVAMAKLVRLIKWKDDIGETDNVITDENGHFSFPIKKQKVKLSKISQFVIAQEISAYFNNNEYVIWTMGKGSKVLYGELGGKPENLHCELTGEIIPVDVDDGLLGTSCKWDPIK